MIAKKHLDQCINDNIFSEDREKYIKELSDASKVLNEAIEKIRKVGIKATSKHFGD